MSAAIRVELTRGPGIESVHEVHAAVVDDAGKRIASWGEADFATYLRSSAKPMQAVPVVETGAADHWKLGDEELALCCASHAGAAVHTRAARSILRKAGVSPEFLQSRAHGDDGDAQFCCAHPMESLDATLQHNCSGKHSGMLATAKFMNESLENYREPTHPVQRRIMQVVADLSEVSLAHIEGSVIPDGCGAPIFQLPLRNLALAFAKLGSDTGDHPHAQATRRLSAAMRAHPVMVAGEGSWNTVLMQQLGDVLFSKSGAEGVMGVGLRNGIGIAVKVLDGNHRATNVAVLAVIRKLQLIPAARLKALREWEEPAILNGHQVQVGILKATF